MFARDPRRGERYSLRAGGLSIDYSRQRVTRDTLDLLLRLARRTQVADWRERMFAGDRINSTEGRAALHVALRGSGSPGRAIVEEVRRTRRRMRNIAARVRGGRWSGASGKAICNVVHIGVGGSDLGVRLAVEALRPDAERHETRVRFVTNVDPDALDHALAGLQPAQTLFVIASKSFTTPETLANARAARAWLARSVGRNTGRHLIAVTGNAQAAREFGVPDDAILHQPDWVGGRYSIWSALGLTIEIACGARAFDELAAGANEMDRHFLRAPLERNAPVLMALLGVWNTNFLGASTHAVLPYADRLALLPAYLQQLEMESNGKRVDRNGRDIEYATCPVVWGGVGTSSQHAFFQHLHQGTQVVPADFLVPLQGGDTTRRREVTANALANAIALALGTGPGQVEPHLKCRGNQPNTCITFPYLDARTLGNIIALYEHKVFTQGVIWNVNSFDQWGVELGKSLASRILPALGDLINPLKKRRRKT